MTRGAPRHWMAGPAELRLRETLDALVDACDRTPCQTTPDVFVAEHREARAAAAAVCAACPVILLCAQAADEIAPSFGVWAGSEAGAA
jgi:hypothetical protein